VTQCVAVRCSVLRCIAGSIAIVEDLCVTVCCSVLHCVAVCCGIC